MTRILLLLGSLVCLLLAPVSRGYAGTKASDPNEIDTPALLQRLRQLMAASPVRTKAVVDSILVGPWETNFDKNDERGINSRRQGTTRSGLDALLLVDAFPDDYRHTELILGSMHVIVLESFGEVLFSSHLSWIDSSANYRERSVTLYRDRSTEDRSHAAWSAYLSRLSAEHSDLPQLKMPVKYREPFSKLYLGGENGVFGTFCDYAGVAPNRRVAQVELLAGGQATALRYVLRARSVVSRLYAAEALLMLERNGVRLSGTDAELIQKLRGLSGEIDTCAGCENALMPAGEVFRLFSDERLSRFLGSFKSLGYIK